MRLLSSYTGPVFEFLPQLRPHAFLLFICKSSAVITATPMQTFIEISSNQTAKWFRILFFLQGHFEKFRCEQRWSLRTRDVQRERDIRGNPFAIEMHTAKFWCTLSSHRSWSSNQIELQMKMTSVSLRFQWNVKAPRKCRKINFLFF